ncbi:DUF4397 domain-containing protein [Roseisolibacter sp. H3M3-2]|uniref:DUF4397 domain-containing protein n=1 Tax=Roseisolibacter sp. H3M3-2 TaxID=3031323 RepID=UPI0023DC2AD3|nr:DUF4397 domain-containing protein [Roseisolibacter sp. H3M3-2]MDF1504579.1 DUF4397 domain-containing protein [Roseisolibacter sp. H3M3-2]
MPLRRPARLLALAALAGAVGCDEESTLPALRSFATAAVRVVNLLPSAPTAGLFAGGTALGGAVGFGAAGGACLDVPVGEPLAFRAAGQATDLATTTTTLDAGQRYTVVLYGTAAAPQVAVLSDAGAPSAAAGTNAIRVFNATATSGDVWVTAAGAALAGAPTVAALAPGQATTGDAEFGRYPTASTQVRLFDVGATAGAARATTTVAASALSAGRAGTVFLTDATLAGGTNASVVAAPCP